MRGGRAEVSSGKVRKADDENDGSDRGKKALDLQLTSAMDR